MGKQVVFIWGGLIALYLVLFYNTGTASGLKALTGFASGSTKALQGRG